MYCSSLFTLIPFLGVDGGGREGFIENFRQKISFLNFPSALYLFPMTSGIVCLFCHVITSWASTNTKRILLHAINWRLYSHWHKKLAKEPNITSYMSQSTHTFSLVFPPFPALPKSKTRKRTQKIQLKLIATIHSLAFYEDWSK